MKKSFPYLIFALFVAIVLLAPGVWWGDSLNAYIQTVTGVYGAAQPVLLAFFLGIMGHLLPGTLLPFIFFVALFYGGIALYVFYFIKNKYLAPLVFFSICFFPPFFANIGVIQTESLQLATLSVFIPLTIIFYSYQGPYRKALFIVLIALLTVFSIVRYDTPQVSLLLSYWLCYTLIKQHNRKVVLGTLLLFVFFKVDTTILDSIANIPQQQRDEMRNSLIVTDIAAISAESGVNYVPDYCWRPYFSAGERNVDKLIYGHQNWSNSFYSYIYNIDPSVGLFHYNTTEHTPHLFLTLFKVIIKHPVLFLKYHFKVFFYLVFNDNFNMGIWGGLKDSHVTHASIKIDRSETVDLFLKKHGTRFGYSNGLLFLAQDNVPIDSNEEKELLQLVDARRAADITWMKWYSNVPVSTYSAANPIAEKYVVPFCELFKKWLRPFCFIFPYFLLLLFILPFYKLVKPGYYRFTFFILCSCGISHLLLRILIITDPVYRFGMITILFAFFSCILLYAGKTKSLPE